ncbi:extracellular solute-binding protein family 5 [Halalkalicoccus jeotgali B3]|uniref:Extracellular solute-binding protein family 5 n=2 Tax=Halalkalicoccus jeotgali TaxID=413810 RepID=D8JCZ0_HALJB|nr:extracellular solute-binding protein family 5 [Halalkalicoccus jeotgali B3]ELY38679.1 extracellular solute-binding protein family 5 [Halalkalicoccus jeotgali B3]
MGGVSLALAGCLGGSSEEGAVEPIELIVTTEDYDPIRYEFGNLIAENWRELGFEVEVTPLAWNTIVSRTFDEQNFDTFTLNWAGRAARLDPDVFCYSLHHSSQTDQGGNNMVNYESSEYDEYAEAQRKAYDENERQEAVMQCQELFAEDQPRTPIANQTQAMPYLEARFDDIVNMMGEGLMSFWTAVDSMPANGVEQISLGYPSDVNNLNPVDGTASHDTQTMRLIYDKLVRIDQEGMATNWLAEDVTVVDDTTIRATIRDGHQWHDGEDLTVEDVKFSFDYLNEYSSLLSSFMGPLESTEIIDERTVEFTLSDSFAPFIPVGLGQVFIIPQHIWENIPEDLDGVSEPVGWENPEPVGSGPFEFVSWNRDEQMVLQANQNHFHTPNIPELIKIPGADMQSLVRLLEDESLDMIGWVPGPDTVNRLDSEIDHVTISSIDSHNWYHINYQLERPPFDDVAVRHALADAIPKQDIVDIVMDGMGTVTHTFMAAVNDFWHNPDVREFGNDLGRAQITLEEAGYTLENGRLYYPEE